MRIAVTGVFQHSAFSSGMLQDTLGIAEVMRELGHEVHLLQMVDNPKGWFDDISGVAKFWTVKLATDASGYDLLIQTGRLVITAERRKVIAKNSVWVVTRPFLLAEMEASIFPAALTPARDVTGFTEVWITEAAAEAEAGDSIQALELLTRVPVRRVPTLWTPTIAASHLADIGAKPWIQTTVEELKRSGAKGPMPSWRVHVAETNGGNTSSAVLPLVILREARRLGLPVERWVCHNADGVTKSKFFLENTLKLCTDSAVGLSGEFVGRQRCVEWAREPMSLVMSHSRFRLVRPMLLDLAWAGVPVVHNSPLLRDIGHGLERLYYSGNRVGEACEALRRAGEDLVVLQGIFAPESQNAIRMKLVETFSPLSVAVQAGWRAALGPIEGALKGEKMPEVMATSVPPVPVSVPQERIFRLGFSDMWDDFNPEYNFFSLLVEEAARHLPTPLKVVAGPATAESDLVMFGPFGDAWRKLPEKQPKVFFTGETTAPVTGPGVVLNLGFHHFDMTKDDYLRFPLWILEIDWFGADAGRIQNPKPIPLERCTQVQAAELARKRKFCAFVVSNPGNPVRNAAFQWLNEYKPVDSAGRVFNTLGPDLFAGGGGGGGELRKLEFLKDYKFCLTYENNSARGYTTEKYLHAKAAGCVPIYWGDPAFERDFNVAGCIDARGIRTQEELIAAVRRVDEDDGEWLKKYAIPALDSYKVAWCRRTMAELARRLLTFGGVSAETLPRFLGREATKAKSDVAAEATSAPTPAPTSEAPEVQPNTPLELPLMVTCATRKFLSSLQHWLTAVGTQGRVTPGLQALVFLGSDVPADTTAELRKNFPFATFETLPDTSPPAGAFTDFWAPEHYGWKIWIYNELAKRGDLKGKMILYTDAGSFLCRWPQAWLRKAQEAGVCLLEDPREENARWCSAEFKAALKVTAAEEAAQQRLGGLVAFRAGSDIAERLFSGAYELAKRREVLVGPKWAGVGADGKPFGHRHDQSILSILSLRQGVATVPLDTVYCDTSLRRTFFSGRSIYVHRGDFHAHRRFTDAIDEAYVINLDRRKDRLERL